MSLGILLIGEPQGSWGSRVAKGGRAGLEDLGLVGTPLPRRAVADPASWPRALPDPPPPSTPSLRGVGGRSHCWASSLPLLHARAGLVELPREKVEGTTTARRGCVRRAGGRGECGNLSPPRPAQPPSPPLHLQPNGLLRAPYLIPATAAAPAPSRSPPRPRAPKRLGGALSVSVVVYPSPAPAPGDPGSPAPSQGAGREARWGPLPPCPCSCFSPAAGRPAGPTSPRTVSEGGGGARGGGVGPGRGFRPAAGAEGACWLCLEAGVKVASRCWYPCVCLWASVSLWIVGCAGYAPSLYTVECVCVCSQGLGLL